jgi:hypothetical protein
LRLLEHAHGATDVLPSSGILSGPKMISTNTTDYEQLEAADSEHNPTFLLRVAL